jgi:hypothetical protein
MELVSSFQKEYSLLELYLQIPTTRDRFTLSIPDGTPPVCLFISHAAALRHTPTNRGDDITACLQRGLRAVVYVPFYAE